MSRLGVLGFTTLACCMAACEISDPNASIIKGYEEAACIPLAAERRIKPRTREWRTAVSLHDGSEVVIKGAEMAGGRIAVAYPATHREVLAVDPDDYIYPSDVRLDARHDHLYVKAQGLAGGIFEETWLFEYDLDRQRLVSRQRIRPSLLTAECPDQR
jgi:hypothetical protein